MLLRAGFSYAPALCTTSLYSGAISPSVNSQLILPASCNGKFFRSVLNPGAVSPTNREGEANLNNLCLFSERRAAGGFNAFQTPHGQTRPARHP